MLTNGNICTWDNAGELTQVVILDGPKPAAEFRRPAPVRRIDRFALVALLSSGECTIAHVDDLVPLAVTPGNPARIRDCA